MRVTSWWVWPSLDTRHGSTPVIPCSPNTEAMGTEIHRLQYQPDHTILQYDPYILHHIWLEWCDIVTYICIQSAMSQIIAIFSLKGRRSYFSIIIIDTKDIYLLWQNKKVTASSIALFSNTENPSLHWVAFLSNLESWDWEEGGCQWWWRWRWW